MITFLVALFVIVLQITLTEREHFRIIHSWIGFVIFVFAILTPTLGILQLKVQKRRHQIAKLSSLVWEDYTMPDVD